MLFFGFDDLARPCRRVQRVAGPLRDRDSHRGSRSPGLPGRGARGRVTDRRIARGSPATLFDEEFLTSAANLPRVNLAWNTRRRRKHERLARISSLVRDGRFATRDATAVLQELIEPGDRVCLEGDNQKQADFLSRTLATLDPERTHDLHLLISVIGRPEHSAPFERGIPSQVDFSYSGPQSLRLAQQVADGRVRVGAIHTYLELFARYFV